MGVGETMLVSEVSVDNTDVVVPPLIKALHIATPAVDLALSAVVDEQPLTVTPQMKPQAVRVTEGARTLSVR